MHYKKGHFNLKVYPRNVSDVWHLHISHFYWVELRDLTLHEFQNVMKMVLEQQKSIMNA